MLRSLIVFCLFSLCACRPSPFQVKALSPQKPHQVEGPSSSIRSDFSPEIKADLKKRYQKLNSPSFALINGYYRLPNATPYGSATIVREYSYFGTLEGIKIESEEQDYAIKPMLGDEALRVHEAINSLLNLGVHIKEMPMTDALALAKAEQEAAGAKKALLFSEHLPPGVDYLISINKSFSERGAVFVGRVVSKEGRLLAFRVIYHGNNQTDLSTLILSLFEDTINRI